MGLEILTFMHDVETYRDWELDEADLSNLKRLPVALNSFDDVEQILLSDGVPEGEVRKFLRGADKAINASNKKSFARYRYLLRRERL